MPRRLVVTRKASERFELRMLAFLDQHFGQSRAVGADRFAHGLNAQQQTHGRQIPADGG
jgi:hypothetical protein